MSTPAIELQRRISQAFPGPVAPASDRARVLLSAYTISPKRGSEPAGGWNVVTRLAEFYDVTVLTSPNVEGDNYRREIDTYLDSHPVPGLRIHYVEPPLLARKLMKPTGSLARLLYYTGYAAWQRAAYREAKQLHAQKPFQLIHQLNMTGYREPGYLWKLDAPFVWGPIGGAANVPKSFLSMMSTKDQVFYTIRNAANVVQRVAARRCRRAAEKASTIWYIGLDEKHLINQVWQTRNSEAMIDSGTQPAPRRPLDYDGQRPLRLVWSGVHIGRKAMPILIEALAKLKGRCKIEVAVLGDGPQTERWDTLAIRLGVQQQFRWLGRLPREQAMAEMARADALAFTSLTEGAPYVVLEAISMGLPVICHDACGMSVAVDNNCGIRVPLVDLPTSIDGFANAIAKLAENPAEVARLAAGANHRATQLTWDAKVEQIRATYDRVLNKKHPTPQLVEFRRKAAS